MIPFTTSVCESLNATVQSKTLLTCETTVGSGVLFFNLQFTREPSVEAWNQYM